MIKYYFYFFNFFCFRQFLLTYSLLSIVSSSLNQVIICSIVYYILSTTLLNLLKSVGTGFNLSISNLSIPDFRLDKSTLLANCDVSTRASFFYF